MRNIIVHYHLFKNAGSSIDHLLSQAYGELWVNHDPGTPPRRVSSTELLEFINENPHLRAMSSHMLVPPVPESGDVAIHPVVILREPVTRVMSAYLFEWKKQKGVNEPVGSLAEYVRAKFEQPRANAIEDFQCLRLGNKLPGATKPDLNRSDDEILRDAQDFISQLPVFGLVERFDESLEAFSRVYGNLYPEVTFTNVAVNTTQNTSTPLDQKIEKIQQQLGDDLYNQLIERNQLDIKLYEFACAQFESDCHPVFESHDGVVQAVRA